MLPAYFFPSRSVILPPIQLVFGMELAKQIVISGVLDFFSYANHNSV
jgi:hypothetical protein